MQTLYLRYYIYINTLILSQVNNLLGFNNYEKVVDSLSVMSLFKAVNNEKMYDESAWLGTFVDILVADPYNYIFKYFKDNDIKCSVNPFNWLDQYAVTALRDIRQNKYVLQYLLENEQEVRTMKNFDFMGPPDQRVLFIKNDLKKL